MKSFYLLVVSLAFVNVSIGQYSYEINFQSPKDDIANFICNNELLDEQIVVLTNRCSWGDSTCTELSTIYTLSNMGDTIKWSFENIRHDTIIKITRVFVEENGEYFLTGEAWHQIDTISRKPINVFDYHARWTIYHDQIWESFSHRPSYFDGYSPSNGHKVHKLINGNYLVGKSILTSLMYMQGLISEVDYSNGNIIKTIILPYLHGYIQGLTYNIDSSAILCHTASIYLAECDRNTDGVLILDTINYDTIQTYCYNRDNDDYTKQWCVDIPFNASLSNDNKLIVAGTGNCFNNISNKREKYLFIYKYDTSFLLIDRKFLTQKDTFIDAGWYESIAINNNNEICIVGNHDRGVGYWTSHYNWIYLAKVDEELNLISERYLGGDAAYTIYSMDATPDGGMVICGTKYNYLSNDNERDSFVIKTDGSLWVGQHENSTIPIHSAIVYPNPGIDKFYLRTKQYPSTIKIYDIHGKNILSQRIGKNITTLNTTNFPSGHYTWRLFKKNEIIDNGKIIKYKL